MRDKGSSRADQYGTRPDTGCSNRGTGIGRQRTRPGNRTQPAQALLEGLIAAAPTVVREVVLFDVYQGKGVDPGKKSLAFRVVMQDTEKTLADGEVDAAMVKLIETAAEKFAAKLRS